MKVKEGSEKVGLKLNIQKTKIMASGPITSWQIDGEKAEKVIDFTLLGSKITVDGDCSLLILVLGFLVHVARNRDNSPVTSVSRCLFFPCAPSVNKSTRVLEEPTPFLPPPPSLLLFFLFHHRSRGTPSRGMCSLFYPAQWLSLRGSLKPTRL